MRWLIVVALTCAACARGTSASLVRWNADERVASFSAPEPDVYSTSSMESQASQRCPTGFAIVEEGRTLSPDVQAYAYPTLGGGIVAGTVSSTNYYWVVRCNDSTLATAAAGDALARFDRHFVLASLRDGTTAAGELVARTQSTIKLRQTDGSTIEIPRGDVLSIKLR